ncbi:MFS transporter [Rathayibacter toxicus]|uniref:MFS transporter n=1 Tax=Rathayibacter toxicus TaxID=145458 RepID=UPI001C03A71C|nr:MFS transporter [Rathayibacter toxicus]QWL30952.1 MFS transporter [Rathayibacter toxicus]
MLVPTGRLTRSLMVYVPPSRPAGAVVFTAFIDSLGTGVYLAGSSLFFAIYVGLPIAEIGVGLSLAGLAAFVSKVPIGSLADRFGARKVLVVVQALRGGVFLSLAFVHGFPLFAMVCIAMGVVEGPVSPLTQAVISSVVVESARTRTLAIVRSVRNVAFSLGALVASPLLAVGASWSYMAIMFLNAASFFLAAVLMAQIPLVDRQSPTTRVSFPEMIGAFRNRPYIALAAACGVMSVHTSVLMIAMPLWAVSAGQVTAAAVPLLIGINTVLSVLLQVPVARVAEGIQGGLRSVTLAAIALAFSFVAFGCMAITHGGTPLALVIGGCILLTLGEVLHSAGEWELSFRFSDPDRRARDLSVFALGEAAATMVGPAILTVALVPAGLLGWIAAAAVMVGCVPAASAATRALQSAKNAHHTSLDAV